MQNFTACIATIRAPTKIQTSETKIAAYKSVVELSKLKKKYYFCVPSNEYLIFMINKNCKKITLKYPYDQLCMIEIVYQKQKS